MRAVVGFMVAATLAVGCAPALGPSRAPVGVDAAHMAGMSVALESGSAICPGQDVPLPVDASLLRNDELFLRSAQGTVDGKGIFHASADPRLSANGFTLELVPARGDVRVVHIPVSYECVHVAGIDLTSAKEGARGIRGDNIGRPIKAPPGGPGSVGGHGADAPAVVVYVTLVKTPDHEKLIAALVDSGGERLTLARADAPLRLAAHGGAGGHGGRGGQGGVGITWCTKTITYHSRRRGTSWTTCVERNWSFPGDGGAGGNGGDGGAGGRLEVHVDQRHPELVDLLALDVAGGAAGLAGASGEEGETSSRYEWKDLPERFEKSHGMPGSLGLDGHAGLDGEAVVVLDDVSAHFTSLGAIEVL